MKLYPFSLVFFLFIPIHGLLLLENIWQGMMDRNDPFSSSSPILIHRPRSETPGDAVSEGVGYGLILAMYANDSKGFNRLLEGAEATMWNGGCYDWRVNQHGQRVAYGAATDAEQDIATMLIMADARVRKGEWVDYQNGFYRTRAITILSNLWNRGITSDGIVMPGYGWGGYSLVNVGYLAPAWYRIYAQFDPDPSHDWNKVIDRSYTILEQSPGHTRGLIPDWMTAGGQYVWTGDLGYNAYGDGKYMFKDAIRTLWRIGTDMLWFNDSRAISFIENAASFLSNINDADFFQMDGSLVPKGDTWVFDGGQRTRARREHSALTVGMWVIPLFLTYPQQQQQEMLKTTLLQFYSNSTHEWDSTDNELYFEQFLATFGYLFLSKQWMNLYL